MKYNPAIHKRRSIRLKGYDYSQDGLYFITICVKDRELLFGKIKNEEMILNDAGQMIQREWEKLTQMFGNVKLHEFRVMPNHFHGIIEIVPNVGAVVGATLVVAQDGIAPYDGISPDDGFTPDAGSAWATLVVAHDDIAHDDIAPYDFTPDDGSVGATLVVAHDGIAPYDGLTPDGGLTPYDDFTPVDLTTDDDVSPADRATTRVAPTDVDMGENIDVSTNKTLGNIIGAFKSITTVEYIRGVKNWGWPSFPGKLWQRNYYESIIRDKLAYQNISAYIIENPARWKEDKFYVK